MTHLKKTQQHRESFNKCADLQRETLSGLECLGRQLVLNEVHYQCIPKAHALRSPNFIQFTLRALVRALQTVRECAKLITVFSRRVLNTFARIYDRQKTRREVAMLSDRMLQDIGLQPHRFNSESDNHLGCSHLFPVPNMGSLAAFTTPITVVHRL